MRQAPPTIEVKGDWVARLRRQVVEIAWLTKARPDLDASQIARQVGCSVQRVHQWQRVLREAQHAREGAGNGFGCPEYDPNRDGCERCLDDPDKGCPYP